MKTDYKGQLNLAWMRLNAWMRAIEATWMGDKKQREAWMLLCRALDRVC